MTEPTFPPIVEAPAALATVDDACEWLGQLRGALLGALAEALVEALAAPHLLRSVAALASPEALRGMPLQALAAPRLPRWASLQAPDEQRQHTHHPPSLLWKRDETPNESSQ